MEVETLGMARSLGWKVHMRCADGYREDTKSVRRCVYRKQLDLRGTQTLDQFAVGTRESSSIHVSRSTKRALEMISA